MNYLVNERDFDDIIRGRLIRGWKQLRNTMPLIFAHHIPLYYPWPAGSRTHE